jgi:hypothetical protein
VSQIHRQIDSTYEYKKIAKERMLWISKPLGAVFMMVWCVHPSTTMPDVVERNVLLGFLMGALFGLIVNMKVLRYYLITRRHDVMSRRNRMPDEYYFGKIKTILFTKSN